MIDTIEILNDKQLVSPESTDFISPKSQNLAEPKSSSPQLTQNLLFNKPPKPFLRRKSERVEIHKLN